MTPAEIDRVIACVLRSIDDRTVADHVARCLQDRYGPPAMQGERMLSEVAAPRCEAEGCANAADFAGWVRQYDGMGLPTGLMQKRNLCCDHMSLFIGYKPEEPEAVCCVTMRTDGAHHPGCPNFMSAR